mgnify:CR=1 FL=1
MQIPEIKMQKSTMIACAVAVILFLLWGFGHDVLAAEQVAPERVEIKGND